jgi:hypothetical protein
MAAKFIEPENLETEENLLENEELEQIDDYEDSTDDVEQPSDVEDDVEEEDDIPEKYKGKSVAEIVQMHKEAEKLLGRHSSEVGELRRIVDDFVKANLDNNAHERGGNNTEDEVDFFDDPKRAVEQAIANNPALAEVTNLSKQMKQQAFMNKLNTEFPEHVDLVNDQDFVDWIGKSNVRQQLYQRAANQYDWDSAEELLSNWRAISGVKQKAQATQKEDLKQERKKASTGSSKASGEQKSRKIYRRADIINLMRKDPDRYAQLSDEIMKAYQEGRVR